MMDRESQEHRDLGTLGPPGTTRARVGKAILRPMTELAALAATSVVLAIFVIMSKLSDWFYHEMIYSWWPHAIWIPIVLIIASVAVDWDDHHK